MDNYYSQWRIWAKLVAIFDLIISILVLVATLIYTFAAGALTVVIESSANGSETRVSEETAIVEWIMWVAVAILVTITTVSMWASIQLIKATELGREAKECYQFCQSWRIVCIVFIVLNIVTDLMMHSFIMLVVNLLVRGVFLYLVQRYIQELETFILSIPSQMKPSQKV